MTHGNSSSLIWCTVWTCQTPFLRNNSNHHLCMQGAPDIIEDRDGDKFGCDAIELCPAVPLGQILVLHHLEMILRIGMVTHTVGVLPCHTGAAVRQWHCDSVTPQWQWRGYHPPPADVIVDRHCCHCANVISSTGASSWFYSLQPMDRYVHQSQVPGQWEMDCLLGGSSVKPSCMVHDCTANHSHRIWVKEIPLILKRVVQLNPIQCQMKRHRNEYGTSAQAQWYECSRILAIPESLIVALIGRSVTTWRWRNDKRLTHEMTRSQSDLILVLIWVIVAWGTKLEVK